MLFKKYFKPKSVTWWASLVPLVIGLYQVSGVATPGLDVLSNIVAGLYGGISPFALINLGLAGIGIRGMND